MKQFMDIIENPARLDWPALMERNITDDREIERAVGEIVERVRCEGDAALHHYAMKFDGVRIETLELSEQECLEATENVSDSVKHAITQAARNIGKFHAAQMPKTVDVIPCPGVHCMQRTVPLQRVGLYIPGGRAPLFSTVLMLGLPAKIAGCKEIILCTPKGADGRIAPEIVYAARVCGINRIFCVGGAQAVAAMAYGTESIPRVDKIFGPGNRYVTKAKQLVSRITAIDMPAGPSEVLVMADTTARPDFVAADLLSQAEHGPDSQSILVCQTMKIAQDVAEEVYRQAVSLNRVSIVEESLEHSRIVVLPTREDMVDFANAYAAEHLIISMEKPWDIAADITAAGSVFIGNYSPESAGDYASGTNHTLPTGGWATSYSGVNYDSFVRKITYQEISREGLTELADTIITMANAEGLDAHAAAVKIRIK